MNIKKIKNNTSKWIKRITYNTSDVIKEQTSPHCPNYATRCCLTCNKCWKPKE
ncbi:hypothetical protein [Clostridium saccharoperbutylacetonicum]